MKRTINLVVIHCSASPDGKDFKAADIDAWHKQRAFKRDSQARRAYNPDLSSIGYHRVIDVDGTIQTGRSLEEIGAHVAGSNAKSIGVCMVGQGKYTMEAWAGLRNAIINLATEISGRKIISADGALDAYKTMGIKIKGHRDCSPDLNGDGKITRNEWLKDCPCFNVSDWISGGMMPLTDHIFIKE